MTTPDTDYVVIGAGSAGCIVGARLADRGRTA
jgi:choline dehydrogenase-like flavoprotein